MQLPQELLIYTYQKAKIHFLLVLSTFQGWGIVKIKKNQFTLYAKGVLYLFSKKLVLNSYNSLCIFK